MHATLPAGRASIDRSIASMDINDSGWTVPWAMYHDSARRLWLNGAYTLDDNPHGTAQMLVRRDEEGWHVDIGRCTDHRWNSEGYSGRFPPIQVATLAPEPSRP